jgi:hypothetical protein
VRWLENSQIGCATWYEFAEALLRGRWRRIETGTSGAGPGPGFGFEGQADGDGIELDVGSNAIEFDGSADPVVKGFIVPEVFLLRAQDGIRFAGGDRFEAIHYARDGDVRIHKKVDMIGHDDKGMQGVEMEFPFTDMNCIHDTGGDARILKPKRARGGIVQQRVHEFEFSTWRKLWKRTVWWHSQSGCAYS